MPVIFHDSEFYGLYTIVALLMDSFFLKSNCSLNKIPLDSKFFCKSFLKYLKEAKTEGGL
jgi:hypothetical protein